MMITDPDEYFKFLDFVNYGVQTTDTLNQWRKKSNGVIKLLYDLNANSSSNESLTFDFDIGSISLKNSGVKSKHLDASSVIESKIANNAVTTNKLDSNSVSNIKIQDNAIITAKIKDGNITVNKLDSNSVSTIKIQDDAVTTLKIKDGNVTSDKLANNSVSTSRIIDDAVSTIKIKDGNITSDKLANNSVSTEKLQTNAVTNDKVAINAIKNENITDWTITQSKIGGGGIQRQTVFARMAGIATIDASAWTTISLEKSITVIRANSKVRIQATVHGSTDDNDIPIGLRIWRTGFGAIGNGSESGDRVPASSVIFTQNGAGNPAIGIGHIDFMETGLAVGTYSYKVQVRVSSGHAYINRSSKDSNSNLFYRTMSTIFLTEYS